MNLLRKKIIVVIVILNVVVIFSIIMSYINKNVTTVHSGDEHDIKPHNIHLEEGNKSCHYKTVEDALPSTEDTNFFPKLNSIFFIETSCRGGLTSRQACVIESAARAHLTREIYVLFSAPVNRYVLKNSSLTPLLSFHNIKLVRVHLMEYAKNTPLEEMVSSKPFYQSAWWVEHTADVLRCLTLYKWGGVYLDTDMLVTKSLTPLGHNWVGKQEDSLIGAGAISVSTDQLGLRFAEALSSELQTSYQPDIWIHNGPGAIMRALEKICNTPKVSEWPSKSCSGLKVYDSEYFYPVQYSSKEIYFKAGDLSPRDNNAYTHHFWNNMTYDMKIEKESPFMKLAEKFCPSIFKMYGNNFN